jgi:prepilin-type N-terminal cleavage/methylation domain-containing protein/prepilin-type processing-associated H-X9-DG protein
MRVVEASGHAASQSSRRAFSLVELPVMSKGKRQAFSLVELLVVIGILGLLMGLLFPAISKARRQAVLTTCLARMREIGSAIQTYANTQDGVLPYGTLSNSADSPYSPRGLAIWKHAPGYVPGEGITIVDHTPSFPHPDWLGACAAPVARTLLRLGGNDLRMWQCPAQPDGTGGNGVRTDEFVLRPSSPTDIDQAFVGWDDADEWRPGYWYLATWEYAYFIRAHVDIAAHYRMKEFITRNIAGLPASRARPADGAGPDHVVVCTDYSVLYHSHGVDVYDLPTGAVGNYVANFAFLDGHAESRYFKDFDSYLAQFHAPINSGHQAGGY